jgi:hypothetical protein
VRLRRAALAAALGLVASHAARAASPEEDARATFDAWLAAQNEGRFSDYAALYGKGFTGVKRSRTRTTSFDRAGWLADRERMFGKKMKVEATHVRILAKPKTALVVFTQRWSSGNFSDVGPKHLAMRRTPTGYEIVREELFASNAEAKGGIDVAAFQQFAFVLDGEVVVSTEPKDDWASGPPRMDGNLGKRFVFRAKRPVDITRLPPELSRLKGTAIRLFDAKGVRCEAKLGTFLLRGRSIAAMDDLDEGEGAADGAWSSSSHFLVAKVDGGGKACAQSTWARAASLPAPTITTAVPAPPDLEQRALEAFAALPESRAIQRRFDTWAHEHHKPKGKAWFQTAKRGARVRVIRPAKGPAFVAILASGSAGDGDQCGGDGVVGTLSGLWEITGPDDSPKLVLRNEPDEALALDVAGAVDVDGDGQVELLFDGFQDPESTNAFGQGGDVEHGLLRARGGVYVDVAAPETPVLICPC